MVSVAADQPDHLALTPQIRTTSKKKSEWILKFILERLLRTNLDHLIVLDFMHRDVGYITMPRLVLVGRIVDYENLIHFINSFVRAEDEYEYRRLLNLTPNIRDNMMCGLVFHCWGDGRLANEETSDCRFCDIETDDLLRVGVLSDSGRLFLAGELYEKLDDKPYGYLAGSRESFERLGEFLREFIESGLTTMALEHRYTGGKINPISYELEFCTIDSSLAQSLPEYAYS